LEILTPNGWQLFAGVAIMGKKSIHNIQFDDGSILRCAPDHGLLGPNGNIIYAENALKGCEIVATDGMRIIVSNILQNLEEEVYTPVEVDGGHLYYSNNVVSRNCSFMSDDDTLINPLTFPRLQATTPIFYTGTIRWFVEPEPNKTYLVALDPSLGTQNDYGAIEVFQIPEMIQVAEWQNNEAAPRRQVTALMEVMYALDSILRENPEQDGDPEIFWTFENNTIGEAILTIVEDTGEERFPGSLVTERRRKGLQMKRVRKGLNTTNRSRLSSLARMKSLIESDRMTLHSQNLIRELKNFVAVGNSFKAKPGEHDDLIMATSLIIRMLDVVLSWETVTDGRALREYIEDSEFGGEMVEMEEPMPVSVGW
jgi:hypothetical protein